MKSEYPEKTQPAEALESTGYDSGDLSPLGSPLDWEALPGGNLSHPPWNAQRLDIAGTWGRSANVQMND